MRAHDATAEELLGRLNDVERKNAPNRLFLAGDQTLLHSGARVAIVGSRTASAEGRDLARQLAVFVASRGAVVVSGLAAGIDTEAHQAAIAAGGRTIAVLGTSLDEVFPAENRPLQERIMREHLAISQFEPGVPAHRTNFPRRNRTMALLSDLTVIVEAGEKSGSLHQGWEALRLGRPLFLTDLAVSNAGLAWPSEFMKYGAMVIRADDMGLLLEFLPERSGAESAAPSY